jgi:hemolysin activation/secretion protein
MFGYLLNHCRRTGIFLMSLVLMLGLSVPGAWAAVSPPDSGAALEGTRAPEKPAGEQPEDKITVTEPAQPASNGASERRVRVKGFHFSGELLRPEAELQQLLADQTDQDLTLADLNRAAEKVTRYLRTCGYPVATAYIPPQTVKDGIIELTIIPGKYGAIRMNNGAGISGGRIEKMLGAVQPGSIVTRAGLERVLLLINDLPGVLVKATLTPGAASGSTDLILNISDTQAFTGMYYTDNWGSASTGRYRGGMRFSLGNPSHYGDELEFQGMTTADGLGNVGLGYNFPVGFKGMRAAVNYSRVEYRLGEDFADLDAFGTANVLKANLSYPFRRGRGYSLYGSIGYGLKDLNDTIGLSHSYNFRNSRLWDLGLNGQYNDLWRGKNDFSLVYTRGELSFKDDNAAQSDAQTARTAGSFDKLTLTCRRQQYLSPRLSIDWRFTGQTASKNLDSAEKLTLGGADGVRAYPQGEASGDQGYLLTGEFRWLLPQASKSGNAVYLANFYDYGEVEINQEQWGGSGDGNRRSLSDAGLGLIWARQGFNLRLDYAHKLGAEEARSDSDSDGRFWLQCVRYF